MPKLDADELVALLEEQFPHLPRGTFRVERQGDRSLRLRQRIDEQHLRPGGTVSGPTLMALADTATYLALLAQLGPLPFAVTTSLTIHFLRRPQRRDLVADAALLKLGKRLAVAEVRLFSDGEDEPVAQATVSYALPWK